MSPVAICHRCPHREQEWTPPVCHCTISGRDITEHAASVQCPRGRFTGIGNMLARLFHATGLDRIARAYERITGKPCGCGDKQAQANERGAGLYAWVMEWREAVSLTRETTTP